MSDPPPAQGRHQRPSLAARLSLISLPWLFLLFWIWLLWLLGRTLSQLVPAALNLDPAALLLWLTLGPMTLHLAQAPFHRPRKPSGPPVFLRPRLFSGPLVFLPLTGPGRLETGPAFSAVAGPGDQARLLASAEARLKCTPPAGRLSLMLAGRSPLDLAFRAILTRWPRPLAAPIRLLHLMMSPSRQLTRLWGYLSFLAWKAGADPGPADDLTLYKRHSAWDLHRRARIMARPEADEDDAAAARRLISLKARLAYIHGRPGYGTQIGEAGPEPETGSEWPKDGRIWLNPRYRGAFLDLPVTLYAAAPAELYALGRPEKDLNFFYPPELARELENLAELAGEREFLAELLAGEDEDSLIWLDGRLLPAWSLAAELKDLENQYERALKRIHIHNARCRAAHLAASAGLGPDWPEALRGWGALLWLAEHGRRALTQARDDLRKASFKPPAAAGGPAEKFYAVSSDLAGRLADLEQSITLNLAPPTPANWSQWRTAWPAAWAGLDQVLGELRDRALAGLLTVEDQVAGGRPQPAPSIPPAIEPAPFPPPSAPPRPLRVYYPSDRFKVGPARSALAALILALLLWQGWSQGLSRLIIHNGLSAAVTVSAGGRTVTVPPFSHRSIKLRPGVEYEFTAAAEGRPLENFRQRLLGPRPAREIYNVAGAAPLMEWRSPRSGQPGDSPELFLGRPRWLTTRATVLFKDPPGNRRALVLSGYGSAAPADMLAAFPDPDERAELARLHAPPTPPRDPRFLEWLALLDEEERQALIRERLPGLAAEQAAPPLPAAPPLEAPDMLELLEEPETHD